MVTQRVRRPRVMITPWSCSTAGRPIDEVIADLEDRRVDDARWQEGRTFGLVFDGGPSVHDVAAQAARLFLHENALNTNAFPSLASIQDEVVGWTGELLHAPSGAAGFLTSGGTESIQCAVLAARERGRAERGIESGKIVVAESAHAAFHKSAHLFSMPIVTTPVTGDWTADVEAMAAAVDDGTVLVVGSAPQYPQGLVDPIPAVAELAASVGAWCHVDACMGGFVLPFAEMLGRDVPAVGLPGGGRALDLGRRAQAGLRPQGRVGDRAPHTAAAPLPDVDVRRMAGRLLRLAQPAGHAVGTPDGGGMGSDAAPRHRRLRRAHPADVGDRRPDAVAVVTAIDGLRVVGDPTFHLLAIAADESSSNPIDVFALGDEMAREGGTTTARALPIRSIRRSVPATLRHSRRGSATSPKQ